MTMRILDETEIQIIWRELSTGSGDEIKRRALQLMLVTGQRPEAIAGMHRCEVAGDWWTIPAKRNTSRRPHVIHLTSLALGLLGENPDYVFPAADASHPISVNSLAQFIREEAPPKLPYYGLERWTPMDLRKSVRSHMDKIHAVHKIHAAREAVDSVFCSFNPSKHKIVTSDGSATCKPLLLWETELLRMINYEPIDTRPLKFGGY